VSLWDSPPLIVAASRMTGVRCYIDVDPDDLRAALSPLGPLEFLGPAGGRQVCCELWRATDGRVLIGGLERQEWALVAGELGRLAGLYWGASMAWALRTLSNVTGGDPGVWGPAARPGPAAEIEEVRRAADLGAERGAEMMARGAMNMTRWTVIEPYHELLLSVPDVLYEGCEEPVSVALGMATDSQLAFRLDRLSWYGYNKRMAEFSTDTPHEWDVRIDGVPLLRGRFHRTGRTEYDFERSEAASGTIQPLLGGLEDRRPMIADLRRDLCESGDDLHEVEGTLWFGEEIFPLMRSGSHDVRSTDAPPNRISVGFERLETFVTYPRSPFDMSFAPPWWSNTRPAPESGDGSTP